MRHQRLRYYILTCLQINILILSYAKLVARFGKADRTVFIIRSIYHIKVKMKLNQKFGLHWISTASIIKKKV